MHRIRHALLRIASENPEVRSTVLAVTREAGKWNKLPKGWTDESVKKFWDKLTGENKHKVTKCIKQMDGKVDDPGAFCGSLADKVMGTTKWRGKKAMQSQYVSIKELPPALIRPLKEVGYGRRNIEVISAQKYSAGMGGEAGLKSFTIPVDMASGRYKIMWGSWGGANMFSPQNQVDLDTKSHPIPLNGAVIQGSTGGGRPVWAQILVSPDNLQNLIPSGDEATLTGDESKALHIMGYKSSYRKDGFLRENLGPYSLRNPLILSLADKGMIKITGRGARVTLKGKNYKRASTKRVASTFLRRLGFNKFNAPELMGQLMGVLDKEGLDGAVKHLRDTKTPQVVDKAWKGRDKKAAGINMALVNQAFGPVLDEAEDFRRTLAALRNSVSYIGAEEAWGAEVEADFGDANNGVVPFRVSFDFDLKRMARWLAETTRRELRMELKPAYLLYLESVKGPAAMKALALLLKAGVLDWAQDEGLVHDLLQEEGIDSYLAGEEMVSDGDVTLGRRPTALKGAAKISGRQVRITVMGELPYSFDEDAVDFGGGDEPYDSTDRGDTRWMDYLKG